MVEMGALLLCTMGMCLSSSFVLKMGMLKIYDQLSLKIHLKNGNMAPQLFSHHNYVW